MKRVLKQIQQLTWLRVMLIIMNRVILRFCVIYRPSVIFWSGIQRRKVILRIVSQRWAAGIWMLLCRCLVSMRSIRIYVRCWIWLTRWLVMRWLIRARNKCRSIRANWLSRISIFFQVSFEYFFFIEMRSTVFIVGQKDLLKWWQRDRKNFEYIWNNWLNFYFPYNDLNAIFESFRVVSNNKI